MTDQTPVETEAAETAEPAEDDLEHVYDDDADWPEDLEVPEPEESQWPKGSSPYDKDHPDQDEDPVGPEQMLARGLIAPFVRTGLSAVRWALGVHSWSPPGMCQQFTHDCFNVGAGFGSAIAAWNGARYRHPTANPANVPTAVPVFFAGGSRGLGHAAFSLGNGLVRSTDWPSSGRVGTARITDIERAWGQRFLGWTEDINHVRVWEHLAVTLAAGNVARAMRVEDSVPNGRLLKKAVAAEVGVGNMDLQTRVLGKAVRTQYALVQQKYLRSQGTSHWDSADVDGIPGPGSLAWLGRRRGFSVNASVKG